LQFSFSKINRERQKGVTGELRGGNFFIYKYSELLYNISEMKKTNAERQLQKLVAEKEDLLNNLSAYKEMLRGTIYKRGNICGKAGCKCKAKKYPVLHGPYQYLSHRSIAKTNMIFLNDKKLKIAIKGIEEYKQLIGTIYRISEINFQILRYHYKQINNGE